MSQIDRLLAAMNGERTRLSPVVGADAAPNPAPSPAAPVHTSPFLASLTRSVSESMASRPWSWALVLVGTGALLATLLQRNNRGGR